MCRVERSRKESGVLSITDDSLDEDEAGEGKEARGKREVRSEE